MKNNKLLPLFLLVLAPMVITSCTKKNSTSSALSSSVIDENAYYKVTLNPCSGNKEADANFAKEHVISGRYNTIQPLPAGPAKEDYKFSGWSTKYDKNTGMGAKSHKLTENQFKIQGANQVLYGVYIRTGLPDEQAQAELQKWIAMSEPNHLYYHYYRFQNDAASYDDWDVWAWSYAPTAGEGTKHDWVGRTQNPSHIEQKATGDATVDQYAGAYIDIDLKGNYHGGWDNEHKVITDTPVSYAESTSIGLQIVQTSTRTGAGQFWTNDGSNLYINLDDYAVDVNGGKAYHIFVVQDNVQSPSAQPTGEKDPFEGDVGENVTYGNKKYNNVNWSKNTDMVKTSKDFSEVGVGYQIMVSSFADSDGDGFGDIYGITQKLDYLEKLGVKALWLTPIQLSDSYHGYDITDYEKVDPKFGSAKSPAALANGGKVDSDTALADYKDLINKAHERGMKIVMDLVLNHTSTSNAWFVRSANLDEHFRGYYQWGNHETQGGIEEDNNWYPYGSHPYSYYAKFGSGMPELNFSYVDTRIAVEEMSIFWARDIGVDGFRLDAIKHIFMENEVVSTTGDTIIEDISASGDYSSDLTKNLQFFRELKTIVTTCSQKDVFFVGENFDGHAYHCAPYYEAFDSLFDFYSYFNLTSGAATGRKNTTSAFGTVAGYMNGTSPYTTAADTNLKGSSSALDKANGSAWNFPAVYNTYNKYRGDTSLPGLFTSNHDIARVINRIAGGGTPEGLQYQGNVTTSNYASFEQSADCVKIAELMMPGLTWIYYGDEIGMTGNFPDSYDPADVANIPYADLWYRQPMKWVANGQKGDEAGTTDYYVTGSSMKVEQDKVNKDSVVKPALEQMNSETSEYGILRKFVALKSGADEVGKALRLGSISSGTYFASGDLAANVLCFERKSGSTTVKVAVNFNNQTLSAYGLSGTVLASYNGASASSLPAYSAIVVKA